MAFRAFEVYKIALRGIAEGVFDVAELPVAGDAYAVVTARGI